MAGLEVPFEAVDELEAKWRVSFDLIWPAYREWYLSEGDAARPDLETCREMLRRHMPELFHTYERLVELAGSDELAARCLSLYRPPHILVGCSQGAWTRDEGPVLVRNYDYPASRIEGVVYATKWGKRRVIGMRDCLWGLLDGMNDAGLAVSLTFGGRRTLGDGFSVPLVVRYLLEVCDTVSEAREKLEKIPIHAAQNLTLLDRSGEFVTAYLGPEGPRFIDRPAATNHQERDDWPEYAQAVRSHEREQCVLGLLDDPGISRERYVEAFLEPPLHKGDHSRGFATLYTAAYFPDEGRVEYRWPDLLWEQSFDDFHEGAHTVAIGVAGSDAN